jgi:hypothetical protein
MEKARYSINAPDCGITNAVSFMLGSQVYEQHYSQKKHFGDFKGTIRNESLSAFVNIHWIVVDFVENDFS